jgi:hypothetical protein
MQPTSSIRARKAPARTSYIASLEFPTKRHGSWHIEFVRRWHPPGLRQSVAKVRRLRQTKRDETVIGGSKTNRAYVKKAPKKKIVMALVERGGAVRSVHIPQVTARTLRPIIVKIASRKSRFMTDEGQWYVRVGEEFASHHTVNHWQKEYVRGDAYTNTAENYFSILKRGIYGVYQHVSEAHLHRYLAEFDFRYSNRAKLGVTDGERAAKTLRGIQGKRLTYRGPRQATHT